VFCPRVEVLEPRVAPGAGATPLLGPRWDHAPLVALLDARLSPREVRWIIRAVASFNRLPVGQKVLLTADPGTRVDLVFTDRHDLPGYYGGVTELTASGPDSFFSDLEPVVMDLNGRALGGLVDGPTVVRHELGHARGLADSAGRGVMSGLYAGAAGWSARDVRALVSLYGPGPTT